MSRQICLSMHDTTATNVIISSAAQPEVTERWRIVNIGKSLWQRISGYWRAKLLITRLVREHCEGVEIFLPHIHGILGNYVFSSRLVQRRKSKISFYYEGAAMVDMHRQERALQRYVVQRSLLSLAIFHRFVNHPDIVPMDSDRVHRIYTPFPERTIAPESKKVLVKLTRANIPTGSNGVLVIGVDAGDGLIEGTAGLVRYLKEHALNRVFFKGHYADRLHVFEEIAAREGLEFTQVNDSRCVEEVIGDLPVSVIVCTHFSSALLNLKVIYQNDLKVLFLAHPAAIGVLGEQYVEMISSVGVEIVNL